MPRQYAQNDILLSAEWVRPFNPRFFLASRTYYQRDTILAIDHRAITAMGPGINLILSKRGQFYVVPAIGVGAHSSSAIESNGAAYGFVAFEKIEYKLGKDWAFTQWGIFRSNIDHVSDRSSKAHVELMAPALHKRLFLSLNLDYTYEGALSPQALMNGATRNDVITSVKFNYRIGP
jgi:hypothetical protein